MERTNRGFGVFGTVVDSRGLPVRVQESSEAGNGAHCWLFVEGKCLDFVPYGKPESWREHVPVPPIEMHSFPSPHLTVAQAEELAGLLLEFVRSARANELTEPEQMEESED